MQCWSKHTNYRPTNEIKVEELGTTLCLLYKFLVAILPYSFRITGNRKFSYAGVRPTWQKVHQISKRPWPYSTLQMSLVTRARLEVFNYELYCVLCTDLLSIFVPSPTSLVKVVQWAFFHGGLVTVHIFWFHVWHLVLRWNILQQVSTIHKRELVKNQSINL